MRFIASIRILEENSKNVSGGFGCIITLFNVCCSEGIDGRRQKIYHVIKLQIILNIQSIQTKKPKKISLLFFK